MVCVKKKEDEQNSRAVVQYVGTFVYGLQFVYALQFQVLCEGFVGYKCVVCDQLNASMVQCGILFLMQLMISIFLAAVQQLIY